MKARRVLATVLACALFLSAFAVFPAFAVPETPVIPYCQHDWGAPSYVWSEDLTTCSAVRVCKKNANHKNTETVTAVRTEIETASCTEPAASVFTAVFQDEALETQVRSVVTSEALGHDWGKATYEWSEDNETCTAYCVCNRDPNHTVSETAESYARTTQCATDTQSSVLTYFAEFRSEAFSEQRKDVTIPKEEVVWGDANGDGGVSSADIVRLKNFFAFLDETTGKSSFEIFPGADANYDGAISNKDIVRLKTYLANYDSVSGTSTVILGPDTRLKVSQPATRADLDAIPVATSDMTEDQLRQIVLQYFRFDINFPWVSYAPVQYVINDGALAFDLSANQLYCGMPYTNAGSCVQQFMDYYNTSTGEFRNPFGTDVGSHLGNNCSSSVYWAWGRISSTIRFRSTEQMTFTNNVVQVGDYEVDTSYKSFKNSDHYNTRVVCDNNGLAKMSKAYAELRPADACVAYDEVTNPEKLKHHTMMVYEVHVVKYASGNINPDSSYIIFYEQNSLDYAGTLNGQSVRVLGRLNRKSYFKDLFDEGYIPITCKELDHNEENRAEVKAATATLSTANGTTLTVAQLAKKKVTANYSIARVVVTVTNANGKVVASAFDHATFNTFQVSLSNAVAAINAKLPAGSYNVTVEADLSNGELLTAFTGTLTKS